MGMGQRRRRGLVVMGPGRKSLLPLERHSFELDAVGLLGGISIYIVDPINRDTTGLRSTSLANPRDHSSGP